MQIYNDYELLRDIFKEGPVVIFVWKNEPDWPVEFVTDNVLELTGYSVEEWLEKKILYKNIIFKEDLKQVEREVLLYSTEIKLKRWKHQPYRILKKNGEVIWINDHTVCIYDDQKNVIRYIGYLLDITNQIYQQQNLQNELNKYLKFFEFHSAIILVIDPDTGRIIDANRSATKFYGYSKNQFKNLFIYDINALPKEEIFIRMKQAKNLHQNYFQFPHRLADGSIREVEVYSSIIEIQNKKYLFSVIHDITERVQLQKQLEYLNLELENLVQKEIKERIYIYKKLRLILNQNLFGIGIVQDNVLIEYNDYLLNNLDLDQKNISNTNFFDLFIYEENQILELQNLLQNKEIKELPVLEVQKKGVEKYFILLICPFVNIEYKNKIEFLVILYDITDKKILEKEKKEKEQMLLHQFKLASIGESLSVLAHQWRQPLNSVSLILQYIRFLIESSEKNKKEIEKTIEDALQELQFLSSTIDDFKDFYKLDLELEYFFVKESIQTVIKFLRVQLENNNISVQVEGEDFQVYGYNNYFKHVILNLINNAKDSIINVRHNEPNYKGKIDIRIDAKKKLIQICDNGTGIKNEVLPKLFQPYVTTKKMEGSGLGLYISYILLKKMNANIYACNREQQKGACFSLFFRE